MRRRHALLLGSAMLLLAALIWPNRADLAAFPDIIGRITSYNVCYTKLLRTSQARPPYSPTMPAWTARRHPAGRATARAEGTRR